MSGYAEIAAHYRREITEGRMNPGDKLPSHTQAVDKFKVNRTTVIRAYDVLKAEGLIDIRPGKGAVVTKRPRIAPLTGVSRVMRMEVGGDSYGHGETSSDHMAAMKKTAPDLHEYLGMDRHEEVVVRSRVFRADGEPVVFAVSVIHPRALNDVPCLLQQGKQSRFWHEVYSERTGKMIHRSPELRGARLATAEELDALGVDIPDCDVAIPVLVTRTLWHDEEGPIEVWEDVHAPGKWQAATE